MRRRTCEVTFNVGCVESSERTLRADTQSKRKSNQAVMRSGLSLAVAGGLLPALQLLAQILQAQSRRGEPQLRFDVRKGRLARFMDVVQFLFEGLQPGGDIESRAGGCREIFLDRRLHRLE